jgi:hypothetical protein
VALRSTDVCMPVMSPRSDWIPAIAGTARGVSFKRSWYRGRPPMPSRWPMQPNASKARPLRCNLQRSLIWLFPPITAVIASCLRLSAMRAANGPQRGFRRLGGEASLHAVVRSRLMPRAWPPNTVRRKLPLRRTAAKISCLQEYSRSRRVGRLRAAFLGALVVRACVQARLVFTAAALQ